jgi:hypothetical protein
VNNFSQVFSLIQQECSHRTGENISQEEAIGKNPSTAPNTLLPGLLAHLTCSYASLGQGLSFPDHSETKGGNNVGIFPEKKGYMDLILT